MDKKMLQATFRKWKKVSGAQYAITNPDGLGDCQSCVNSALCDKYGVDSKGIWVKHWTRGMNGDYPLDSKDNRGEDRIKSVYIAHDLDEEMAKTVYEVFGENYNILPAEYNPYKCFCLFEKDTIVYEVSYTAPWKDGEERRYSTQFTDERAALNHLHRLFLDDYNNGYKDIALTRVF